MKKKQFQVFILVLAVIFTSSCLFRTSSTEISGRVTEYGDKPIVGAEITFGGIGSESKTVTDENGRFTVKARHRPTQMLYLQVITDGYVMREKVEFPGFLAPDEPIKVKLMKTIPRRK